ncbi:hypothetical protein [Segnochrobactrum spirostomi]|uniref:ATP-binding cassette domain-containing protein n=1 Tax=Segnochrobactrum spirostomi TaxID=2608987 RepID=A0A6A7YA22_9HYPH|nr:hypothetical protein [Segnochrobactrum spirostomi]MQT14502.1 hypothetical protein [Segnochrobactrum spirostomi]
MTDPTPNAVELRAVSKIYGASTAVRDISMEIPRGAFVTILGPSGCGLKIAKHSDVPGMHSILGSNDYDLSIDGTFKQGSPLVIKGTTPQAPGVEMTISLNPI